MAGKKDEIRLKDIKRTSCSGGNSFDCRVVTNNKGVEAGELKPGEHYQGFKKVCYRCFTYLGCSVCAQRDDELICLSCDSNLDPPGNWGTKRAVRKHGHIIRDPEVAKEAWKIVHMRGKGQINQVEQDRLFADLSRISGYNFR